MDTTERQRVLVDLIAERERAEAAVQALIAEREACERLLREGNRPDRFRDVTGRSALENAIEGAKRVVATLDRAIDDCRKALVREGVDVVIANLDACVMARRTA